jgi:hypothetical protein
VLGSASVFTIFSHGRINRKFFVLFARNLAFQNRRGRRVIFRVREAEVQLPRAARRKQFRALAVQHHERFARFLFQTDTWR